MTIQHFIVHKVARDEQTKNISTQTRDEENSTEGLTAEVTDKLVKLFNESSLSTGSFVNDGKPEELQPRFAELLDKSFNDGSYDDFVTLTKLLAQYFATDHLSKAPSAPGGYLVFYHAERGGMHYLSVVLLRMAVGMTLNDTLEFTERERLDLEHLHLAARINISDWKDEVHSRYISFKIGRSATEMRDYFSDFIGCKEFTAEKEDTKILINAIKDVCEKLGYDHDKTSEIRGLAHEYCYEKRKDGKKVDLAHIDRHLFPEADSELVKTAQADPYNLSAQFSVDLRELKTLVRYRGNSKKLSVSFDQELLGNEVEFDPELESLTINTIPPKLLEQLKSQHND